MASSSNENGNGHPDLVPYYSPIRSYLRRFESRRTSADDLAQQTYALAYRGLERGSVPRHLQAWLIAIARNVGYSQLREDGRYRDVELDDLVEATLYDESVHEPVESLVSDEDRRRVRAAIDTLTREEQLFVYAWHAPDRERFDPAMQFGMTPGAAKARAYRLRKRLREMLEDPRGD